MTWQGWRRWVRERKELVLFSERNVTVKRITNTSSGATKTYTSESTTCGGALVKQREKKLLRCHYEDLPRDDLSVRERERERERESTKWNARACAARETRHAVAPKRITSRSSYIDVLRSCTHDEPIAAVANAKGSRRRWTTDRSLALICYVT